MPRVTATLTALLAGFSATDGHPRRVPLALSCSCPSLAVFVSILTRVYGIGHLHSWKMKHSTEYWILRIYVIQQVAVAG